MFERFTERAKKVVSLARAESQRCGREQIATAHLLLGLVAETTSTAARVLRARNLDLEQIRVVVERLEKRGRVQGQSERSPFSPATERVLELAREEAHRLAHDHVGTEHLLLGLLAEERDTAAIVLKILGAELEEMRREVLRFGAPNADSEEAAQGEQGLYGPA